MNISEVYERIRERESGASAESRTRAELHIQKIKELREKHKAFIKMPHTKACDMIKYCLAIDRNLGINRIHKKKKCVRVYLLQVSVTNFPKT